MGSTGTTPNPYRFGGAWGYITDPSGMQQLGARYYWPEVGRFGQQDPLRTFTNRYVYAKNEPLYWIDPEGLWEAGGEAYALVGGGVWFGVDPCTGNPFIRFRAGFGLGLGVGIDPKGGIPGGGSPGTGEAPAFGTWGGVSANIGAGIGPLGGSIGAGAGGKLTPNGLTGYAGAAANPSFGWGGALGGSAGFDVGLFVIPMPF
jgi:RHS repeat-associated protein